MEIDTKKLRALAEAALAGGYPNDLLLRDAMKPQTVIALLDELEGWHEQYRNVCDYNARLVQQHEAMRLEALALRKDAEQQHKMWATDPNYIYPAGHHD